jgi:hypothetical protein
MPNMNLVEVSRVRCVRSGGSSSVDRPSPCICYWLSLGRRSRRHRNQLSADGHTLGEGLLVKTHAAVRTADTTFRPRSSSSRCRRRSRRTCRRKRPRSCRRRWRRWARPCRCRRGSFGSACTALLHGSVSGVRESRCEERGDMRALYKEPGRVMDVKLIHICSMPSITLTPSHLRVRLYISRSHQVTPLYSPPPCRRDNPP